MKNYSIVGMDHQGTTEIVAALNPGVTVTLVREPENKFDKNAIAVWVDGRRVGYVPKNQNVELAKYIDLHGDKMRLTKDENAPLSFDELPKSSVSAGKAIDATFIRSPNSGYPMVSV